MDKIKKKDNRSFGKLYGKIPDKFYDIAGFVIVVSMMILLSAEEIYRFVTPKWSMNIYMMFYYVVGMMAEVFGVFYIISLFYKDEKFSFKNVVKSNIWDLMLLFMFCCIIISVLLADDRCLAMEGTDFRNEGLNTILVYVGLYVSAKAVQSEKLKLWIIRIWAIVITGLSVPLLMKECPALGELAGDNLKNFQAFGDYSSLFKNPNHYAYVLLMGIMALAALVIIEKRMFVKITALAAYGFNIWAIIINDTLGGYIAVVVGVIFLVIITGIKDKRNFIYGIALILVFAVISGFMMNDKFGLSSSVTRTYDEIGNLEDSAGSGRMGLWKQGIKYVGEKPIFGYGPEGSFNLYFEDGFDNDRPHNEYLQHMMFFGVPAGLVYILALITMFIYCIKRIKKFSLVMLGVGGIVIAYCVSAFFGNTMYYTSPYFFTFLGIMSQCHKAKLDKEGLDD